MKRLIPFTLIALFSLPISVYAAIGDVNGETTCTIIKSLDKKAVKKSSCTYEGVVESSMKHTLSHIRYDLKSGELFETIDDSTFDFNKKGDMLVLSSPTSINDLPAKTIAVRVESYDIVPEQEMKERHKVDEAVFPDVLHCFKLEQYNEAFCIPYDVLVLVS